MCYKKQRLRLSLDTWREEKLNERREEKRKWLEKKGPGGRFMIVWNLLQVANEQRSVEQKIKKQRKKHRKETLKRNRRKKEMKTWDNFF